MIIFVTGATGLVGSHCINEFLNQGFQVKALVRNKSDLTVNNNLEVFEGDVFDSAIIKKAMKGCDVVLHTAALVSFSSSKRDEMFLTNVSGTANIVNFCLKHKVEKLCYVSSTAALSYNSNGLTDESFKWIPGPEVSGYSISKFAAEKEVWRGIEEGLNAVIINPCVILGPGNWKESSLSIFKSASKGIGFYPSGSNAIVDVRDVVFSMHYLMNAEISSKKFLCTGPNISFKELLEALAIQFNKRAPKIKSPRWLSLVVASFSEVINLILRKRDGLTIEYYL